MELYLGDEPTGDCNDCDSPGRPLMLGPLHQLSDVALCEACWLKLTEGHRANRVQFEALIAGGVNRRMANRIMCVRLGLSTEDT